MQFVNHRRTALQYPLVHCTLCRCQKYDAFSTKALVRYQVILLGEQRHTRWEQLAQGCCPNNAAVGVEPRDLLITSPTPHRYTTMGCHRTRHLCRLTPRRLQHERQLTGGYWQGSQIQQLTKSHIFVSDATESAGTWNHQPVECLNFADEWQPSLKTSEKQLTCSSIVALQRIAIERLTHLHAQLSLSP